MDILTIEEVCKITKIKEKNTIYHWINNGQLKAYKLGGNGKKGNRYPWRVLSSDLDRFLGIKEPKSDFPEFVDILPNFKYSKQEVLNE